MNVRELHGNETGLASEAMLLLRPHIADTESFCRQVNDVQRSDGYRLVASFVDQREQAVAAAGFRVANSLMWGKFLYVDDLSTLEDYRGQGHAGALLDWLGSEARNLDCDALHLDSGTLPSRHSAHGLYFSKGLRINAFHFDRAIA